MSTTPTLRDAAQAVTIITTPSGDHRWIAKDAAEVAHFSQPDQGHKVEVYTLAALTQGAGAVEPVAYRISDPNEPDLGHWLAEDPGAEWHLSEPLVPAQQLQQAVARALAPIQQAIRDYHYALDTRQHGGIAITNAFETICSNLGMHWQQGKEAAIRAKGTHD